MNQEPHFERTENKSSCFLVYSTREVHVEKVVQRLADLLSNELNFFLVKLDEARVPGTQLLPDILRYTKDCDLGIVILDGLRPNILIELGMMLAYGTPSIILVERDAKINVHSLLTDLGQDPKELPDIKIDVMKHISDISNISWNQYSLQDDTNFRAIIRDGIKKLNVGRKNVSKITSENITKPTPEKIVSLIKQIDDSEKLSPAKHSKLIAEAHKEARDLSKEDRANVCFHIALSFQRRKEFQTALREVLAGQEVDPDSAVLRGLRGSILFDLGEREKGIELLKEANLKNPRSRYLKRKLLNLLIENGTPKASLKILSQLSYEELLMNDFIPVKAKALLADGQVAESIKLLVELYEYGSDMWAIHRVMNRLRFEIFLPLPPDLIKRIEENVQRAVKRNHIKCYRCFAGGCLQLGLVDLARKFLNHELEARKTKDPTELNSFAFDFIQVGDFEKAGNILRPLLAKFPNHVYLNATWGMFKLFSDKDFIEGSRFYVKAMELDPNDMPLKRMYFYQLFKFEMASGKRKEAREYLKQASSVVTDFKDGEIQYLLRTFSENEAE